MKVTLQIYATIARIQTHLPPQIQRERPVLLLDECGRLSPSHSEFVSSAEAFLAVLKIRFKNRGLHKIEHRQFFVEDAGTKRPIGLTRPWDECFLPDQRVDMSRGFHQDYLAKNSCPSYYRENDVAGDEEAEW